MPVMSQGRLSIQEGLDLFRAPLHSLLNEALEIKKALHGDRVYYSVNLHINYTDYCVSRCAFCAFWRERERSRTLSPKEIVSSLSEGLTEVHITGGLNPELGMEYCEEMIRGIRNRCPGITIKAFTATEIAFIAEREGISTLEVLKRLKAAGLDALPGGGAEVLSERLHKELFPRKAAPESWLAIHRQAHSLGIKSNATMLFGHAETREEIIRHLELLRDLQDETHGFLSFIPLPFQTMNNPLGQKTRPISSHEILRMVAISRLFLDNFSHIKAYWVMMGPKLTAVALASGADDLDGTVGLERVAHSAGARSPVGLAENEVREIIRWAGGIPVKRDGLYNFL
ncbi:MAG: radical SAM protein [candidate division WOR-3 bacterium]